MWSYIYVNWGRICDSDFSRRRTTQMRGLDARLRKLVQKKSIDFSRFD